ncbi:hypothetical protein [Thermogemmatispora tikiterensis]|uniref:Uncharacterized protein n=1 Tax=Thermogemmatispora tikiterensis TaxID=1825093 RepID=A0A328VAJ6_9CHLR|nr:hypothetical protein [Thermogemmatispora tikiterensis]RAQ94628.1 hypothetical protein A4R35_03715 [Thermogemmatispora tikiterensis]
MQGDVDAHHEGVRKEGLPLEGPDAGAGAHVQDGAGALRSERGQVVVAQSAIQGVVLVIEPLVFQRVLGQQIGDIVQVLALPGGGRRARGGEGVGQGRGDGGSGPAAA